MLQLSQLHNCRRVIETEKSASALRISSQGLIRGTVKRFSKEILSALWFNSNLLAGMDPWRTLRYTSSALQRYLLRSDATIYRYAVVQDKMIDVVCVRYPWLRGACLELISLDTAESDAGS